MKTKFIFFIFAIIFFQGYTFKSHASTLPVLNFSDLTSGPKTGNTDGAGGLTSNQHGAIVTIWGNYLGSDQGSSKIYFTDSQGTKTEVAHYYYWKNADGQLPGGPADLYSYHKLQEVAFSIPAEVADGDGTISAVVNGVESSTLPFTVRTGRVRFVKSPANGGSDTTGDGTWSAPWATLQSAVAGGNNKIIPGDAVYSYGVGTTTGIVVGQSTKIIGTGAQPIYVTAYPGTDVSFSGVDTYGYTVNYFYQNPFWNWSKVSVNTTGSGFSVSQNNRIVGVEITGPTVYSGVSGAIGGGCGGTYDDPPCTRTSGGKYLGNYIHNYGSNPDVPTAGNVGTDPTDCGTAGHPACGSTWDIFQHLYYIANRSGVPLDSYEIGWNLLTDNPILGGIHIYDQQPCGDWNGPMKIHNNVMRNQRGAEIDINTAECNPRLQLVTFQIYNNILISDPMNVFAGQALYIGAAVPTGFTDINTQIYNNTIYGFNTTNGFYYGNSDYKNNLMVDISNHDFFYYNPVLSSNNLFYSLFSWTKPSWAGTGSKLANPLLTNPTSNDYSLQATSPAKSAGTDATLTIAPRDFFGQPRQAGSVSMGAIEYNQVLPSSFSAADFLSLIPNWMKNAAASDLNYDSIVNSKDLGIMMSKWQ